MERGYEYRFTGPDGDVLAMMYGFKTLAGAISHAQSSPVWASGDWEHFEMKGPDLERPQ